jgi:hypothetical protein
MDEVVGTYRELFPSIADQIQVQIYNGFVKRLITTLL